MIYTHETTLKLLLINISGRLKTEWAQARDLIYLGGRKLVSKKFVFKIISNLDRLLEEKGLTAGVSIDTRPGPTAVALFGTS